MEQTLETAPASALLAAGLRKISFRHITKQVVKTWLVASAEVKKGAGSLKTEMNQLVTEARAELEREKADR